MNGSTLVDATGIGAGSGVEHFHFIGEFNKATDSYTGLALSNPFTSGTSLQINAYSNSG